MADKTPTTRDLFYAIRVQDYAGARETFGALMQQRTAAIVDKFRREEGKTLVTKSE